jgi:hypothetical protein
MKRILGGLHCGPGRNKGSEQEMFCEFLAAEVNEVKLKLEFE